MGEEGAQVAPLFCGGVISYALLREVRNRVEDAQYLKTMVILTDNLMPLERSIAIGCNTSSIQSKSRLDHAIINFVSNLKQKSAAAAHREVTMILNKHKTVFVHIPKTAGSSIERSLKPYQDIKHVALRRVNKTLNSLGSTKRLFNINEMTHASASDYVKELGANYERYFTFAVVRNPFDRMVSSFEFSKLRGMHDCSFNEYVLGSSSDDVRDQSSYVTDDHGNVIVSFIGRFERLNQDYAQVAKRIQLPLRLPHLNRTVRRRYSEYYDDSTEAAVRERFARDFMMFNYVNAIRDTDDN
jgi:hypothetical protein